MKQLNGNFRKKSRFPLFILILFFHILRADCKVRAVSDASLEQQRMSS